MSTGAFRFCDMIAMRLNQAVCRPGLDGALYGHTWLYLRFRALLPAKWTQLGERLNGVQEVVGSIPFRSTS